MARINLGEKLNYVSDVFIDGCDAPLSAYFETAAPAALHAVLSYYCLDPVQMFTGYVRPGTPFKGKRSGSHGRGTRKPKASSGFWGRFKKVYGFDPNEWLAKKMPFAEDMEGRQVPGGAQWMWHGYNQFERFQNIMFMYTIAEDFLYEIALGVAQTQYCQNQRASVFLGKSETQYHFGPAWYWPCVINEVVKSRGVSFGGGSGFTPNVKRYRAMMSYGRAEPWVLGQSLEGCHIIASPPDGPDVWAPVSAGGGGGAVSVGVSEGGTVTFSTQGPYSYTLHDVKFFGFGYRDEPRHRPQGWCNAAVDSAVNWAQRELAD